MREIEETVGTPYMGFNLGSTKVRQGHADDRPVRFIFESPLIRLMKDESYIDAYRDGNLVDVDERVDSRSVWIFRYYEKDSESFGDGKKDPIESYAEDLGKFIRRVREQVCQGDPGELAKFKVYLVAHSMGRADLPHLPAERAARRAAPCAQGLHVRYTAWRHRDDGSERARSRRARQDPRPKLQPRLHAGVSRAVRERAGDLTRWSFFSEPLLLLHRNELQGLRRVLRPVEARRRADQRRAGDDEERVGQRRAARIRPP